MEAEKLSAEDKAALVNKPLVGVGLSIVLGNGNNHLSSSLIMQINMMGKDELGSILEAIAQQVKNREL